MNETKKVVKTVIFDMDGVIFDTERMVYEDWMEIAKRNHIEGLSEIFYQCIGTNREATRRIMLERYGTDFPYDDFRKQSSELFFEKAAKGGIPVKPGVRELLSYLKENGYRVGLASSTRQAVVRQELEQAGLLGFFQVVIGGDMVSESKPNPEIFLKCCEQLGGIPAESIVIEDSYNGIRAAQAAGMIPIMIPDMVQPDAEMQERSSQIMESLVEVKKWLQECDYRNV